MLLQFDWGGVLSLKIPQFWVLIFTPPGNGGIRGTLGVHRIKSWIKAKATSARFWGGRFYKKCWNLKKLVAPGQPRLPAPFSRAVGQITKFRSHLIPKRCPKALGGDRFGGKVHFVQIRPKRQKLRIFFAGTHRNTDGQMYKCTFGSVNNAIFL